MKTKTQFSLCYLYLITIYFIEISDGLELNQKLFLPQLAAFQNCNAHIISVQVDLYTRSGQNLEGGKYELEVFRIPTIRASQYFSVFQTLNETKPEEVDAKLQCGEFSVTMIHSKSNFKFRMPPPPKQNCIAQIYIEPPNCPTWRKLPSSGTSVHHIFGATMFDVVVDYRLRWTFLQQKAVTWRWIFVHCTKLDADIKVSQMSDLVSFLRGHLRLTFRSFPASPITLVSGISSNTPHSTGNYFTNKTFIVTEIGAIQDSIHLLKVKYNALALSSEPNATNISQLVDAFSVYKWHEFKLNQRTSLSDLENFHRGKFNLITFYHHNAQPVTADHENIYVTNWNVEKYVSAPSVVLALPFKPNTSFHLVYQDLKILSPELASRITRLMFNYKPAVSVGSKRDGESYLAFRDKDELHFVTCVPQGMTNLSLAGLVSPFDKTTWLLLSTCVIISVILTKFILQPGQTFPNQITTFLMILLKQELGNERMQNRILLSSWLIAAIVVGNLYEGENFCRLAAPFAPLVVDNFDEIIAHNFTVYSPVSYNQKWNGYQKIFKEYKGSTLMGMYDWIGSKTAQALKQQMLERMWTPSTEEECSRAMDDSFFDPLVAKCENNAFVANFLAAAELHVRLRKWFSSVNEYHQGKYLTISLEPVERAFWKLRFDYFPLPAHLLSISLNKLEDTGLPQFWERWDVIMRDLRYKFELAKYSITPSTKISLSSNISVVFLLHLGLLVALAFPTILFEKCCSSGRINVIVLEN